MEVTGHLIKIMIGREDAMSASAMDGKVGLFEEWTKEAEIKDGDKIGYVWIPWTAFQETNLLRGFRFPSLPTGFLARVTGRSVVWPYTAE
jgi:hypothetical protein